jgi:hypothetical protein
VVARSAIDSSDYPKPVQAMSVQSDTEKLIESCKQAWKFPQNLVQKITPQHHLDAYYARLDEQAPRLFCEDGKAALNIWEYDDNVKGWKNSPSQNNNCLVDG